MPATRSLSGIIIRRAMTGETDRILTILTPEGKTSVVVRGVRKAGSRKAALVELFHVVEMLVSETRGLPIVNEVVVAQTFAALRTNFLATSYAYWAAELLDRLIDVDHGHPALYDYVITYFDRINAGPNPLDARAFELLLMRELGWQPELSVCVRCRVPLIPGQFFWSDRLGGVLDATCGHAADATRPLSLPALKALRVLSEQEFSVSHRLSISSPIQEEVQDILHHYLETVGERSWRSLALLAQAEGKNL